MASTLAQFLDGLYRDIQLAPDNVRNDYGISTQQILSALKAYQAYTPPFWRFDDARTAFRFYTAGDPMCLFMLTLSGTVKLGEVTLSDLRLLIRIRRSGTQNAVLKGQIGDIKVFIPLEMANHWELQFEVESLPSSLDKEPCFGKQLETLVGTSCMSLFTSLDEVTRVGIGFNESGQTYYHIQAKAVLLTRCAFDLNFSISGDGILLWADSSEGILNISHFLTMIKSSLDLTQDAEVSDLLFELEQTSSGEHFRFSGTINGEWKLRSVTEETEMGDVSNGFQSSQSTSEHIQTLKDGVLCMLCDGKNATLHIDSRDDQDQAFSYQTS